MNIGKERWLALGEAMGWLGGDMSALPGIAIADRAALDAALDEAKGGEVLRLAPGEYGALAIQPDFEPAVTILGDLGAVFTSIKVGGRNNQTRCKGLRIEGVRASYIDLYNIDNAVVSGSDVLQVNVNMADGVVIERNWLHDGQFPLRILRSANFRVIGNIMERAREDTMRISGDSHHGEVRGNIFRCNMAAKPMHGDHLQIFGLPGEKTCPKQIVIEQNLFHDWAADGKKVQHLNDGKDATSAWKAGDKATPAPAQGIFVKDGVGDFEGFTIRHNLMRVSMANGIYTGSGKKDWLVEENIVVPIFGQSMPRIRLAKFDNQPNWNNGGTTVRRNIAPEIMKETPEATVLADNFTFKWEVNGLFAGIVGSDGVGGAEPEDYRLAEQTRVPVDLVENWLEDTVAVLRATLDEVQRTE